jgi:Pretoxin HINT domain
LNNKFNSFLPKPDKDLSTHKEKRTSELKNDDIVIDINNQKLQIINVEEFTSPTKTYNFTLADNHNYFVGEIGVLVHNSCVLKTFSQEVYKVESKAGKNYIDKIWLEHIIDRHASNTTAVGVSKFKSDLSEEGLFKLLQKVREFGYAGFEQQGSRTVKWIQTGENIGFTIKGVPTNYIRLVQEADGTIVTAFPDELYTKEQIKNAIALLFLD